MNKYIEKMFESKLAQNGGTVRRKKLNVLRYASLRDLKDAVRSRGYHLLEHREHYLIICDNAGIFRLLC